MQPDPKSAKSIVKLAVLFALFGSAPVKAPRKMFVKSTPDRSQEAHFEATSYFIHL